MQVFSAKYLVGFSDYREKRDFTQKGAMWPEETKHVNQ